MTLGALRAPAALLMVLLAGPISAEEPPATAPSEVHPQASRSEPKASEVHPQASRSEPKASEVHPDWVYDVANELMSPFCPGRTLADCPSPDAASLRMWIAVQAAAGRTRGDIEEELYARYGAVMRGAPKAEGIGLAAYWIPAAVFAGGGALVVWFLRRATRRGRERSQPPRGLDPDVERKLDELLGRDGKDDDEDERR